MKIGIITIHHSCNYGACLQSFALYKYLELLGYTVEIIDLHRPFHDDYVVSKRFHAYLYREETFKQFLKRKIKTLFAIVKNGGSKVSVNTKTAVDLFNASALRKFDDFNAQIKLSCPFRSIDELYNNPPQYDIYITGSDQVWNPSASSSIEPYFLTFAPQNAPKLTYASSFGVSSISSNLSNRYTNLLNNLDEISVREESGVKLVEQLTGRKAKLVVDPTLLLDKNTWSLYMKPMSGIVPKNYVLVYQLLPSKILINTALKIGKERKIHIYCICKRAYWIKKYSCTINILDAGPSEFLWLIANASCMVTNSFHGTAFSINFATPFCCVLNRKRKNNGRMISLLNKMGMENHILYEDNIIKFNPASAYNKIDNGKLKTLVIESIDYLKKIIDNSNKKNAKYSC